MRKRGSIEGGDLVLWSRLTEETTTGAEYEKESAVLFASPIFNVKPYGNSSITRAITSGIQRAYYSVKRAVMQQIPARYYLR